MNDSTPIAPTPNRRRRFLVGATLASVVAAGLGAGAGVKAFAHGGGHRGWHRGAFLDGGDPVRMEERLDRMLRHLYVEIDATEAQSVPGVHAVVTGKDMPEPYGIIPWTPDEHALALERVRYVGDAVAAVAAVDEDTALAALALIDVQYEVLRAYLEPEESLAAAGSYENGDFIHPARKPGQNGNVTKSVKLAFGDVDGLLESSDVVVEGDYFFEGSTHTPIEAVSTLGIASVTMRSPFGRAVTRAFMRRLRRRAPPRPRRHGGAHSPSLGRGRARSCRPGCSG